MDGHERRLLKPHRRRKTVTELKKCCKVPFPERLFEQYEVGDQMITANVGTG